MKRYLTKTVVQKLNNIAENSFGTTSFFLLNQPKEPVVLKKIKK